VLPIDHQNVRIRVRERLADPTPRLRPRCVVAQFSQ